MKTRMPIRIAVATLAALALVAVAGGCGNSATPSASPSTIYPQASATGTLPALNAYLADAKGILDQVARTAGGLPAAVKGMSVKPDGTWQSSGAQLQNIAAQLGDEASALAALQPPSVLGPVQDAAVKGIRATQAGVQKIAGKLQSGSAKASTTKSQIQAEVGKYKTRIEGLVQLMTEALGSLTGQ